jgi:drug/metabolite transporter (DMT)-like permease
VHFIHEFYLVLDMSSSNRAPADLNEETELLTKSSQTQEKNYNSASKPQKLSKELRVDTEDEEEKEDGNGTMLVVAFIAMLIFQLGNRIYGRLMTYPMHNYPAFVNVLSVGMYVPMCFAYILPMIRSGSISKEQTDIPKYKFAVMGAYDSLAGIMQSFAVNYISNAGTIVLVQQSAIPISMAISVYSLGARYSKSQYSGAFIVLLGIAVVLMPQLFPNLLSKHHAVSGAHGVEDTDSSASASTNSPSGDGQLMWIFVMVVSCVPMVLSSVFKEKALGEVDIDVVYLNGWVAVFQFLFSLPLTVPSSWAINMSTSEIMPNMYGGAKCYFGVNTVVNSKSGLPLDDCAMSPLYVNLYLFFNVIYNILIVVVLKYGSSNILWLSSTIIVPLSNIAFSLDFMPGHKPLTNFDSAGLVVIMGGLVVYRFSEPVTALISKVLGLEVFDQEDGLESSRSRNINRQAEQKQTKYMGLNQIEGLSALFDSRVRKERSKTLFRSPQQIRGSLLLKLGIPPSPHVTLERQGRGNSFIEIRGRGSARTNSFIEMKEREKDVRATIDRINQNLPRSSISISAPIVESESNL